MSIRLVFSLLTELPKEGLVPRIIQSPGKRSLSTAHPYRRGKQHVQHCLVSCQSDLVSDALVMSPPLLWQFCLPLGLSSQDYICTSFQLLKITLDCPCFLVRGPKFYHLTPYGCCISLSLSTFSWWCAPKNHLFRIVDAVLSLLNETFIFGDRHCLSRWQTVVIVNKIYLVLPCARHLLITLQVLPG